MDKLAYLAAAIEVLQAIVADLGRLVDPVSFEHTYGDRLALIKRLLDGALD
jgi:hypothetical protein